MLLGNEHVERSNCWKILFILISIQNTLSRQSSRKIQFFVGPFCSSIIVLTFPLFPPHCYSSNTLYKLGCDIVTIKANMAALLWRIVWYEFCCQQINYFLPAVNILNSCSGNFAAYQGIKVLNRWTKAETYLIQVLFFGGKFRLSVEVLFAFPTWIVLRPPPSFISKLWPLRR